MICTLIMFAIILGTGVLNRVRIDILDLQPRAKVVREPEKILVFKLSVYLFSCHRPWTETVTMGACGAKPRFPRERAAA